MNEITLAEHAETIAEMASLDSNRGIDVDGDRMLAYISAVGNIRVSSTTFTQSTQKLPNSVKLRSR